MVCDVAASGEGDAVEDGREVVAVESGIEALAVAAVGEKVDEALEDAGIKIGESMAVDTTNPQPEVSAASM
jgi:predicted Fe-Mo cluster-binding NifX family protein